MEAPRRQRSGGTEELLVSVPAAAAAAEAPQLRRRAEAPPQQPRAAPAAVTVGPRLPVLPPVLEGAGGGTAWIHGRSCVRRCLCRRTQDKVAQQAGRDLQRTRAYACNGAEIMGMCAAAHSHPPLTCAHGSEQFSEREMRRPSSLH